MLLSGRVNARQDRLLVAHIREHRRKPGNREMIHVGDVVIQVGADESNIEGAFKVLFKYRWRFRAIAICSAEPSIASTLLPLTKRKGKIPIHNHNQRQKRPNFWTLKSFLSDKPDGCYRLPQYSRMGIALVSS